MPSTTVPAKIFVVVLSYNNKRTLSKCLSSIYRSDYGNFDVVVVDNNSTDGSLESVRQSYPRAHCIKNSRNVGFAAGTNVGIRFALEKFADYVLVLNSDAYLQKNTLTRLQKALTDNSRAGAVCPLITEGDGKKIWYAGGVIDRIRMKADHLFETCSAKPYETGYLTGCALMAKKEVFKEIGLFDERFFLYYEDADFSIRAKKAGFLLLVEPATKVIHDEVSRADETGKTYWLVLSGIMFFKKHADLFFSAWYSVYLRARRLKNYFDCKNSEKPLAREVRRAYADVENCN